MTRASRSPPPRMLRRWGALFALLAACSNTAASSPDPAPVAAAPVAALSVASAARAEGAGGAPRPGAPASDAAAALDGSAASPSCTGAPCPLRGWMKTTLAPAMADGDVVALASAFDQLATFAPPGYPNWASIARDGADAARVQLPEAARAACRGCHAQYRERYRRELGAHGL